MPVHELPEFDVECPYCCARFWRDENISCCGGGRLQLPIDQEVPYALAEVILSAHVRPVGPTGRHKRVQAARLDRLVYWKLFQLLFL